MAVLAEQITHAVQTVADPDAAAAEVAAAYRAACRDIDAAEAEGDQALVQARVARRAAEQSTERARVAISAADLAEQHGERAAGRIEQLVTELTLGRQQVERWQAQAVEYRADLAAARSELTAAMAALDAERTHATQRLADQRDRYDELISELRTQLREIGHQRLRANPRQEGPGRSGVTGCSGAFGSLPVALAASKTPLDAPAPCPRWSRVDADQS